MLLEEKLADYRLLLASRSPRRRELLTASGLPYELADDFACEEIYPDPLPVRRCRSTSRSSRAKPTPVRSHRATYCSRPTR